MIIQPLYRYEGLHSCFYKIIKYYYFLISVSINGCHLLNNGKCFSCLCVCFRAASPLSCVILCVKIDRCTSQHSCYVTPDSNKVHWFELNLEWLFLYRFWGGVLVPMYCVLINEVKIAIMLQYFQI